MPTDIAASLLSKVASKSRANVGRVAYSLAKPLLILRLFAVLFSAVSCATSFDMSEQRMLSPGPEWGIVIGSVLVRPDETSSRMNATRVDAVSPSYEFEIVQIQPGDPSGEGAYVKEYRLDAKGGDERMFIARLRAGPYLVRSFQQAKVIGLGGDLDVVFTVMAGQVRYIGRLVVDVPLKMTRGKDYRFALEDARESTLARVSAAHPDLTRDVVTVPMHIRERVE
jgi:hypothetical protein